MEDLSIGTVRIDGKSLKITATRDHKISEIAQIRHLAEPRQIEELVLRNHSKKLSPFVWMVMVSPSV